jgi:hypothetical protein
MPPAVQDYQIPTTPKFYIKCVRSPPPREPNSGGREKMFVFSLMHFSFLLLLLVLFVPQFSWKGRSKERGG